MTTHKTTNLCKSSTRKVNFVLLTFNNFNFTDSVIDDDERNVINLTLSQINNFKSLNPSDSWIIDTGCNRHVCSRRDLFSDFKKSDSVTYLATGEPAVGVGCGTIRLPIQSSRGNNLDLTLKDALYIPGLKVNLIATSKLKADGWRIFDVDDAFGLTNGKDHILASEHNGIYKICTPPKVMMLSQSSTDVTTWHRRLCHLNKQDLKRNLKLKGQVEFPCLICDVANFKSLPHKSIPITSRRPFQLVHSDIGGLSYGDSLDGYSCYVTFIDDISSFIIIYLLRFKSEVRDKFEHFCNLVSTQFKCKVESLRCDNGGEYVSSALKAYLSDKGITYVPSPPYSHQSNGKAERMNETLGARIRAMLNWSQLSNKHWSYCVVQAAYVTNHIIRRSSDKSPLEMVTGEPTQIEHIKTFGCTADVLIPMEIRKSKLGNTARKMILVGQDSSSISRFLDPASKNVIRSRDFRLHEDTPGGSLYTNQLDPAVNRNRVMFTPRQPQTHILSPVTPFPVQNTQLSDSHALQPRNRRDSIGRDFLSPISTSSNLDDTDKPLSVIGNERLNNDVAHTPPIQMHVDTLQFPPPPPAQVGIPPQPATVGIPIIHHPGSGPMSADAIAESSAPSISFFAPTRAVFVTADTVAAHANLPPNSPALRSGFMTADAVAANSVPFVPPNSVASDTGRERRAKRDASKSRAPSKPYVTAGENCKTCQQGHQLHN